MLARKMQWQWIRLRHTEQKEKKKGNIQDICTFHHFLHKVDLATVMAEMFKIGDRNNDDVLTRWLSVISTPYTEIC